MKEKLLEKLAEILEEEMVKESDELEGFEEWDSLTTLSLIAMADSDYNIILTNDKVAEFVTVKDVVDYIVQNAV